MTLLESGGMKKVAAVVVLAALPSAGTYLYTWLWRGEEYLPGRYEDAYHALAMTGFASLGILVVAGAVALFWSHSLVRRR
jgi:hypothetical protein